MRSLVEKSGSQAEFARRAAMNPDYVWQLLRGPEDKGRNIGDKTARAMEEKLGLSPYWFDVDHSGKVSAYEIREWSDESEIAEGSDEVMIHEIEVDLSAGPGASAPQFVETKRRLPFHAKFLARYGAKAQDCRLFPVSGDSMAPVLFDGDTVLVNMKDKRVVEGEIYAVFNLISQESQVKYLRLLTSGSLEISSANPSYRTETVPQEELDRVFVIGRAISRSGGLGKRGKL